MSFFDGIQNALFTTVFATFGNYAVWIPANLESATEGTETAETEPLPPLQFKHLVLFKDPSEVVQTLGIDYHVNTAFIEFVAGDFPGLKQSVDRKNDETLTIEGVQYYVRNVHSKYDGKNFIAELDKL